MGRRPPSGGDGGRVRRGVATDGGEGPSLPSATGTIPAAAGPPPSARVGRSLFPSGRPAGCRPPPPRPLLSPYRDATFGQRHLLLPCESELFLLSADTGACLGILSPASATADEEVAPSAEGKDGGIGDLSIESCCFARMNSRLKRRELATSNYDEDGGNEDGRYVDRFVVEREWVVLASASLGGEMGGTLSSCSSVVFEWSLRTLLETDSHHSPGGGVTTLAPRRSFKIGDSGGGGDRFSRVWSITHAAESAAEEEGEGGERGDGINMTKKKFRKRDGCVLHVVLEQNDNMKNKNTCDGNKRDKGGKKTKKIRRVGGGRRDDKSFTNESQLEGDGNDEPTGEDEGVEGGLDREENNGIGGDDVNKKRPRDLDDGGDSGGGSRRSCKLVRIALPRYNAQYASAPASSSASEKTSVGENANPRKIVLHQYVVLIDRIPHTATTTSSAPSSSLAPVLSLESFRLRRRGDTSAAIGASGHGEAESGTVAVVTAVVSKHGVNLWYGNGDASDRGGYLTYDSGGHPVTCAALNVAAGTTDASAAPDLALGHDTGKISVVHGLFERVLLANASANANATDGRSEDDSDDSEVGCPSRKRKNRLSLRLTERSDSLTVRSVMHWHAHPVASLLFGPSSQVAEAAESTTTLYSGGEEAVLVTWQLERNVLRPSHTLPRIASGGLLSLCPGGDERGGNNGIVVLARDDTLVSISTPDYVTRWRIRGLASAPCEEEGGYVDLSPVNFALAVEMEPGGTVIGGTGASSEMVTLSPALYGGDGGTKMCLDPRSGRPVLAGLRGAPGCLHWFDDERGREPAGDASMGRVAGVLECAPHNRTSRRERGGAASLVPRVGLVALSGDDGSVLVTVDMSLVQVVGMGRGVVLDGELMSERASLKFWSLTDSSGGETRGRMSVAQNDLAMPYQLDASMMHPHGPRCGVAGLALTKSGHVAVTVSSQEDAFRLWHRSAPEPRHTASSSKKGIGSATGLGAAAPTSSWRCRYRVGTPAGSAGPPSGAAAFSRDDSLLAVAFGCTIALWDHTNVTLLTRFVCASVDGVCSGNIWDGVGHVPPPVHSIGFSTAEDDMIVCATTERIMARSVFGDDDGVDRRGWCYAIKDGQTHATAATYNIGAISNLPRRGQIALALQVIAGSCKTKSTYTKVVLLNERTGLVATVADRGISDEQILHTGDLVWSLQGDLMAMCPKSEGGMFALMDTNELFVLSTNTPVGMDHTTDATVNLYEVRVTVSDQVPMLGIGKASGNREYAKRKQVAQDSLVEAQASGFMGIEHVPSTDLPRLSGSFFRSLVNQQMNTVPTKVQ